MNNKKIEELQVMMIQSEIIKKMTTDITLKMCLIMFAESLIIGVLCNYSIGGTIAFWIFQVLGMIVPGIILTYVMNLPLETDVEVFGVGYVFGYMFDIFTYFILMPFGRETFLHFWWIPYVVLLVIAYLGKGRFKREVRKDDKGGVICLLFQIVLFGIELFSYCGLNVWTNRVEVNSLYNDVLYWIGNSISLTKQWPPLDFRHCTLIYNYHYFSSIQLAVIELLTNIKAVILGFGYSFIQPITMLSFGAYVLFRRYCQKMVTVVILIFSLLFTTGLEAESGVNYVAHMYKGQFGFDYGMGIMLILLFVLSIQIRTEGFKLPVWISSLVLFGILEGTKAPFACILLCGMGIYCLLELFNKRMKIALVYGLSFLVVFVLIYYGICNMRGYAHDSVDSAVVLNLSDIGGRDYDGKIITLSAAINSASTGAAKAGTVILYMVSTAINVCSSLLLLFLKTNIVGAFGVLILLFLKNRWTKWDCASLVMMLAGTFLRNYVYMTGESQMYFMMVINPIEYMFIASNETYILDLFSKRGKVCGVLKRVMVIILLSCGMIAWMQRLGYNTFSRALNNYKGISTDVSKLEERSLIDAQLIEACDYLNEKVQFDEAIMSNSDLLPMGVFSERYMLYVGDFMDDSIAEIVEQNEIRYAYYVKSGGTLDGSLNDQYFAYLETEGTCVYSNEEIAIYQVNR